MRHRRLALHSSPIVVAAAFAVLAAAGPAAAADRVKVVLPTAVIRAEPTATGRALAVVAAGTVLDVLLREKDWYQVSVPAGTNRAVRPGYIEARAVVSTTERTVLVPVAPGVAARAAAARARPSSLRWRVFGEAAFQVFTATESFKAIFGDDTGLFYGGGADFTVGRLFTQVSVTHFQRTGQRAFSYNGQSYRLGVEDRVSMTPIVANVGYRFGTPRSRFVPYVAGGGGAVIYRETSDGADAGEDVSQTAGTFEVLGGVEWRFTRSVALAVEGQYQSVRGVLGTGGVSQSVSEKDLGGTSVRVKLLFGR